MTDSPWHEMPTRLMRLLRERDVFLLALDDIYSERGDPREIAKAALAGKAWKIGEGQT